MISDKIVDVLNDSDITEKQEKEIITYGLRQIKLLVINTATIVIISAGFNCMLLNI